MQWDARLFHPALRLIRMGSKLRSDEARAVGVSRAMLQLGSCTMDWQALMRDPAPQPPRDGAGFVAGAAAAKRCQPAAVSGAVAPKRLSARTG